MDINSLIHFWRWLARPPYRGLPWLVIVYFIFCCVMLPTGGVFTGHLLGYDDQVRMTQVLNWVNGAGWYDRTIMRANPPEGFTTIWTRIVDIPLAAVVLIAQQFVSQKTAALVAATVIPLVELAILLGAAAPYFVRPLVGKNKARLIVLFLPFTSVLNIKYFSQSGFMIGQASHHPWYVILDLVMFGAVARLVMGSAHRAPILMFGLAIALLTAVGIEGFPMIAGAIAIMAGIAWGCGRPAVAQRGGYGALCGALGSLLLLPLHQPPQHFFNISFVDPSILGAILLGSAAVFLLIENALLRQVKNKIFSAFILFVVAGLIGGALVWAFPDMLNGPAAGLSPAERKMNFAEHFEAQSVFTVARGPVELISLIAPIILALITACVAIVKAPTSRRRALYISYFGFVVIAGGISSFLSRYYHHAMTTSCAWLLWLWEKIKTCLKKDGSYGLAAFTTFIFIGPFWMLLLPSIAYDVPVTTDILLFPAAIQASSDPCDSLPVADYINAHYDKSIDLIVPHWVSEQFLYQTNVVVDFVSNYPSHDKFIDNRIFFMTADEGEARRIAVAHGIGLVALCAVPSLYQSGVADAQQSFAARLQAGRAPSWLRPVNMDMRTYYRLYEVDRKALEAQEAP